MNLYLNGVEDFRLHVQIRWSILHSWMAAIFVSSTLFWQILLIQSKEWNREKFMNDKWGRNFLGTPPQGRADYAFLQHIIASMNETQEDVRFFSPHGVLFRDEELELRKKLVEMDILDCIIGLGANLFIILLWKLAY